MKISECEREAEVLEAVLCGRWRRGGVRSGADEDLQAHLDDCTACSEVAEVAEALQLEREQAWQEARVPASGQVWWRATIRARAEAACTAARPITMLQGIAGACAAGLCASLLGLAWPSIQRLVMWIGTGIVRMTGNAELSVMSSTVLPGGLMPVVLAIGLGVVVTPIALYLALSDD